MPGRPERTCGRTGSPTGGAYACWLRPPTASTAPLVAESRRAARARRAAVSPSTTTAVNASPSAASTDCFPTLVDLDHVEQRAEHAVDAGQPLGSGAGVRGVERQLQRLDPGVRRATPTRRRRCASACSARTRPRPSVAGRSACSTSVTSGDLDRFGGGAVASQAGRIRRRAAAAGRATHRPRW